MSTDAVQRARSIDGVTQEDLIRGRNKNRLVVTPVSSEAFIGRFAHPFSGWQVSDRRPTICCTRWATETVDQALRGHRATF